MAPWPTRATRSTRRQNVAAATLARREFVSGPGLRTPRARSARTRSDSRRQAQALAPVCSGDLAQPARFHLVDEAADRVLPRDERAGLDAGDRLAHVLVDVGERLGRPLRLDAGLVLDLTLEFVVGEGEHAAVGVMNEDDLLGPEQPL